MSGLKRCPACGVVKAATIEFFHPDKKRVLGFGACKECHNASAAKSRTKHPRTPEQIEAGKLRSQMKRAQRKWTPEERSANTLKTRIWRANNREKAAQWRRDYYINRDA